MTPWLVLGWSLVVGLASARVTRLVVDDTIFDVPRDWLNDIAPPFIVALIACPWCVSAYTTAAVVGGAQALASVPLPLLVWFAGWEVACMAYWWVARVSEAE